MLIGVMAMLIPCNMLIFLLAKRISGNSASWKPTFINCCADKSVCSKLLLHVIARSSVCSNTAWIEPWGRRFREKIGQVQCSSGIIIGIGSLQSALVFKNKYVDSKDLCLHCCNLLCLSVSFWVPFK